MIKCCILITQLRNINQFLELTKKLFTLIYLTLSRHEDEVRQLILSRAFIPFAYVIGNLHTAKCGSAFSLRLVVRQPTHRLTYAVDAVAFLHSG